MSAKALLKKLAGRVAPHSFETLQVIRARRHQLRLQEKWGFVALNRRFVEQYGSEVRRGPFKGLKFLSEGVWANLAGKLVGAYEVELAVALEKLLANRYAVAVDVGCADGYYAAGLALRLPSASVYAYDLDPVCRAATRKVGEFNGFEDRLAVKGRCDQSALRDVLRPMSLVVSDCEGFESYLLDPNAVPALKHADLVIEFHRVDGAPSTQEAVLPRFQATHDIQLFHPQPRDPSQFPEVEIFPPEDRLRMITEMRTPGQTFGVLTARDRV